MQDLRCSDDESSCADEPGAGSVVTSPRDVIHAASPTSYGTDDQSTAAAAAAAMTSSSVTSLQRGGGHVTSSHLPHRAQAKSAAEAPGGGRRVEELEQLVDEVQASEREAWRWLDEALTSGGGRARDLQQYISRGDVTDDDVIDDVTVRRRRPRRRRLRRSSSTSATWSATSE